jgi:hypothetical protein
VTATREFPTHGAAESGAVRKETGIVSPPPQKFLLLCELDIGEGGGFFVNDKSAPYEVARARRASCLVVHETSA